MDAEHVELTPDAEELLAELAAAFEKRQGERRDDEITVQMIFDRMRTNGQKASREKIRCSMKEKADAGELVVRRVGTHVYYSRPK